MKDRFVDTGPPVEILRQPDEANARKKKRRAKQTCDGSELT